MHSVLIFTAVIQVCCIQLQVMMVVSVPSSFLLVSERGVISRLPTTDGATMSLDVTLPVCSLHNVRALAYDVVSDFIYWVDGRNKSIRRARNDGTHVCLPLVSAF